MTRLVHKIMKPVLPVSRWSMRSSDRDVRDIARGWRAGVRTGNSRAGWRAPETQAARKALFTIRGCTRAGRKAVRYVTAGCDGKHAGETVRAQETSSPRIHADLHG